ncbi:hypothetical protein [Singulisphaera acidiphila]|uniref:Uncharacterized protein n=1 Tax=Singulisphaera acidiphila (strain ATCC BAA-1392 / DSM 18658 / VKM B-2454 / MOB10) TaxID=886293 RepID=L0DAJ8_SINAD|nr:hypothetical protein [Singulisphaera acidiphila]AGA26384.1 hypothetical protein Sinac_2039 [Singulisphaera acidiphila DSM 18658]
MILPYLQFTQRTYRSGGPTGVESVLVRKSMYEGKEPDRDFMGAGSVPRVAEILRQNGYEVEVIDGTYHGRECWMRQDQ